MSSPLSAAPNGSRFALRRVSDGKWLDVWGWSVEWVDAPSVACPIFRQGITARSRWHRDLYDTYTKPGPDRCVLVRVVPDPDTGGLMLHREQAPGLFNHVTKRQCSWYAELAKAIAEGRKNKTSKDSKI